MKISNSTYGINKDQSFCREEFYSISVHWNCPIKLLKIRIAEWKAKQPRDNGALFYYEVKTRQEADKILELYNGFDFKAVENWYTNLCSIDNPPQTTRPLFDWITTVMLPEGRGQFKKIEFKKS